MSQRDVTSPDTFAPSHLSVSAVQAGSAAAKAAIAKSQECSILATTHIFVPLAFETLGAWGREALDFVSDLGHRIRAIPGDIRETAFLHQRLSVAIQRGNAMACLGSLPKDCSATSYL